MAKHYPLFKNTQPFDIDVPTPNGGGRLVPRDKYVAGTYFYDVFRQTNLLQLMPKNHVYNEKDVICVYDSDNPEAKKHFGLLDKSTVKENLLSQPVESKEVKVEPPVAKRGRPRKEDALYHDLEEGLEAALESKR